MSRRRAVANRELTAEVTRPRRVNCARIFANVQNARRCSPVSDIAITEKLLLNAGGWQAMKPARELLKSGRVSEAKYEPPDFASKGATFSKEH